MTSSNGNIFRVTGYLCGEFTGDCVWINGWVSNREAGDLRLYRANYDVILMKNIFRVITTSFGQWDPPYIAKYTLWNTFITVLFFQSCQRIMMTSSNGNLFHVTGPLWGESPVTDGFPSKRAVTQSFMFSLMCDWTNGWANSLEAGDFSRHDVFVMQP